VFLQFQGSIALAADRVKDLKVPGGPIAEHVFEGLVAVLAEGIEELRASHQVECLAEERRVQRAGFAEEIGGEFRLDFGLLNGVLKAEVILVAALDPVGDLLAVETATGFAEFVDDEAMRQTVIEHAIEQVASFFGQAGDFAVAPMVGLVLEFEALVLDLVEECGHRDFVGNWVLDVGCWMLDGDGGRTGLPFTPGA
jgi:hypothetical protein